MKVYGLDCEMVYSVWGSELARISLVDMDGDTTLDVMVRPCHTLVDANSRFSGLTLEQIRDAPFDYEQVI